MNLLPMSFFNCPTLEAAENILGKVLCRQLSDNSIVRHVITEVEAYDGPEDKACHAYKGLTPKTQVMFGPAGHWYVYLCYGIHWMLNIVTGPLNYPAGVLIRSTQSITGPGRVTKNLFINKSFNALPACPSSELWIENNPQLLEFQIERTPRIGIDYAGPVWAKKPYRFVLI